MLQIIYFFISNKCYALLSIHQITIYHGFHVNYYMFSTLMLIIINVEHQIGIL